MNLMGSGQQSVPDYFEVVITSSGADAENIMELRRGNNDGCRVDKADDRSSGEEIDQDAQSQHTQAQPHGSHEAGEHDRVGDIGRHVRRGEFPNRCGADQGCDSDRAGRQLPGRSKKCSHHRRQERRVQPIHSRQSGEFRVGD